MLDRRSFFRRTLGAVAAATLAPFLPPVAPPPLAFNSLAFVKMFDAETMQFPTRMDVLYGFATLKPEFVVRAYDA